MGVGLNAFEAKAHSNISYILNGIGVKCEEYDLLVTCPYLMCLRSASNCTLRNFKILSAKVVKEQDERFTFTGQYRMIQFPSSVPSYDEKLDNLITYLC